MPTPGIIEAFDYIEHISLGLLTCLLKIGPFKAGKF